MTVANTVVVMDMVEYNSLLVMRVKYASAQCALITHKHIQCWWKMHRCRSVAQRNGIRLRQFKLWCELFFAEEIITVRLNYVRMQWFACWAAGIWVGCTMYSCTVPSVTVNLLVALNATFFCTLIFSAVEWSQNLSTFLVVNNFHFNHCSTKCWSWPSWCLWIAKASIRMLLGHSHSLPLPVWENR